MAQVRLLQSLTKGLKLLLWLREVEQPMGLNEITRQIGLPNGTTYRVLKTLEQLEFVEKDYGTDNYKIGRNALYVGQGFISSSKRDRLRNILKEASADTQQTVTVSALDGESVLFLDIYDGPGRVKVTVHAGSRVPAYASASGKAILSCLKDSQILQRFKGVKFQRLTPHTLTTMDRLLADLAKIRQRGFAENEEEVTNGLSALSVPINDGNGGSIAALNVVYPAGIIRLKDKIDLVKKLRAHADEIAKIGDLV